MHPFDQVHSCGTALGSINYETLHLDKNRLRHDKERREVPARLQWHRIFPRWTLHVSSALSVDTVFMFIHISTAALSLKLALTRR